MPIAEATVDASRTDVGTKRDTLRTKQRDYQKAKARLLNAKALLDAGLIVQADFDSEKTGDFDVAKSAVDTADTDLSTAITTATTDTNTWNTENVGSEKDAIDAFVAWKQFEY